MDEAEKLLQEKINEMKAAMKAENETALKAAITEIKELGEQQVTKLEEELTAQKAKMSELEIKAAKNQIKSASKILQDNTEKLKGLVDLLKAKDQSTFKAILAVKDITDATAIEDAGAAIITRTQANFGSDFTLAQNPAVERIPAFDLFDSGVTLIPIQGTNAPYVDEVTTGDAAVQALEGDAKAQIEVKYVESVASTKTYAGFMRASDQMLEDLMSLQAWLYDVLRRKLKEAYNQAFFTSDGTGNTCQSLTTLSTEIDITGLELGTGVAGIADVINAALTNIALNNFNGDSAFLNPKDFYKLVSERGTNGQYVNGPAIFRDYQMNNPFMIRIWSTPYVTENTMFVNEIGLVKTIYTANKFAMPEMGLNGEDFRDNMMSIRAHVRLEHVVQTNDRGGLIKVSDIAATVAALAAIPAP